MISSARYAAAIEILDAIGGGAATEQALINWARRSRFAGSGDRAAVRDIVFGVLRSRRSCAALGGGESGRALVLGFVKAGDIDPATVFTGVGHSPAQLSPDEIAYHPGDLPELVALDCPDWLAPRLRASLGADFAPVMAALRHRAPVFLRVNTARTTLAAAMAALAVEGILARPHPLATSALEVTENARKIQTSACYLEGLVELQDAASQAIVEALPLAPGQRVLDYCAGGGGKTLAMAARTRLELYAHDVDPRRMRDLPARAARAGAEITVLDEPGTGRKAPYDLVLADVPCSGSGSWRRAPEAKWTLTEERLTDLCALQTDILDKAAALVGAGGHLAYVTCSLLQNENRDQIDAFVRRISGWRFVSDRRLTPLDGGDGFYIALLTR